MKCKRKLASSADSINVLYEVIKLHIGRDKDLDNIYDRVAEVRGKLGRLCDTSSARGELVVRNHHAAHRFTFNAL